MEAGLGLPVTLSPSPELAQRLAQRELAAGRPPTGLLDEAQRRLLEADLPELVGVAPFPEVGEAGTAAVNKGSTAVPEHRAVQNLGMATSYRAYIGTLSKGSFLGFEVTGHREFLARLRGAEAYLEAKTHKAPPAIAVAWGIEPVVSLRVSTVGGDQMYHGTGFALDVNPKGNNWNFGNGSRAGMMAGLMANVDLLLGTTSIRNAAGLSAAAKGATTEEAFERVAASNDALKRYRALGQDEVALAAHLVSDACPAAAKAIGLAGWKRRIRADERRFASRTHENPTQAGPAGFMDHQKELVVALRDVGGLRWGGTDFGGEQSGDAMHFDGHHMSTAARLRSETKKVAAQMAAASAAEEAEEATP